MSPNLLGFILALVLGTALGFALSVGLYDAVAPLKEWQGLVAGLFATIVGLFTAALIWSQLYIQKRQIEDRRRSEALGAAARLPNALSTLTKYVENCVHYLRDLYEARYTALPSPPDEAINAVQESVRYVDPQSAKELYDLIVHYQILNSRLPDFGPRGAWLDGQDFYDVTLLQSHINRAFPFARNQVKEIESGEFTRDEMLNALRNAAGLNVFIQNEPMFEAVVARIERVHGDN